MRDKSLGCSQRLSLPVCLCVCVCVGSYKRAPKHLMDLEHINGVLDGVPFDFPLVAGCVVYGASTASTTATFVFVVFVVV